MERGNPGLHFLDGFCLVDLDFLLFIWLGFFCF